MNQRKKFSFYLEMFLASITALMLTIMFISCSDNSTAPVIDNNKLEYITPEEAGYSSEKLNEAKLFAEQSGYAAMMVLYDGKVFFSWGNITKNYKCHSIRKPFLSALYGIYFEQDKINLDATLKQLGVDDSPQNLTEKEKQATVRNLLQSRSGIYIEAAAETQEAKDLRPVRGSHSPGEFFYYNNWDFNVLGTIFEQETGTKIFEEFKRRIADPIGMEEFSVENCYYQYEQELSEHPAYSFRMSARDMARFGVLYQKNGNWKGQQIVPSNWISESTSTFSVLDSSTGIGYGYMWYTIPEESEFKKLIGSTGYFHTGIGVHIVMVIPDKKLVIVQRYDTDNQWTDAGDAGMQLGIMVINSQLL